MDSINADMANSRLGNKKKEAEKQGAAEGNWALESCDLSHFLLSLLSSVASCQTGPRDRVGDEDG